MWQYVWFVGLFHIPETYQIEQVTLAPRPWRLTNVGALSVEQALLATQLGNGYHSDVANWTSILDVER